MGKERVGMSWLRSGEHAEEHVHDLKTLKTSAEGSGATVLALDFDFV